MTTIKLNNYYPYLTECITLEVSEEIAVTLSIGGRQCDSYKRAQAGAWTSAPWTGPPASRPT